MRAVFLALFWLLSLAPAQGQELSGLARVLAEETGLSAGRGRLTLTLALSQGVPYRVYTVAAPKRLVLELSEVDWAGFDPATLRAEEAGAVTVGPLIPGWSGLSMVLTAPYALADSALRLREGGAVLTVELERVTEAAFLAASGVPASSVAPQRARPAPGPGGDVVVVLDPGHGGVDPGAERAGVREADLTLLMARELRAGLRRAGGFEVHMTRDADVFVGLPTRAARARQLGADAFVSLHADALPEGYAEGATVHTLASEATDAASALLAERMNRADILGGVDLGGQGDEIATILLDLARVETAPRSEALAGHLVGGLSASGARLNTNPRRAADFAVLRSADVPSVLVEVGFLSSERDRAELQSPERRARIIEGLVAGIAAWAEAERAARAARDRQ